MLRCQSETLGDSLDDAVVRLMSDEHADIFLRDACCFESLHRSLTHMADSGFENFRSFHVDIDTAGIDTTVSHRFCHAAGRDIEDFPQTAIGAQVRCQKTVALFHLADDRCAGAIAEKDASGAIFPVHQTGKHFRPDDEDMLVHACFHQVRCQSYRINVARAAGGNIHGPGMLTAQFVLHHACRRRHHIIRRRSSYDNVVDVIRSYASRFHGGNRCLHTQIRCGLRAGSNMSCLDTGASANPLIAGIYHFFQICVSQNLLRCIMPGTQDPG